MDWSVFADITFLEAVEGFIETGGPVLWAIAAVSLLLWTLILERYFFLRWIYPRRVKTWVAEWRDRQERSSWYAHRIREAMISEARGQLRMGLIMVATLIAVCPLMGLLGTVTGMIQVFDVMALKGTSDARAMAEGVSRATIPTMAGMVVALSALYFNTQLRQRVGRETEQLADSLTFESVQA